MQLRTPRFRDLWILAGLSAFAVGCGKTTPAESASAHSSDSYDSRSSSSEASPPGAEPAPPASSEALASAASPSKSAAPAVAETSGVPPQSHDLVYHVSPDGIWVEILKARFRPSAKTIKVPGGRIVELEVEVETEEPYSLLSGENGPLAVAGRVRRPAEELRVDERGESKSLTITSGKTEVFKRRFPVGTIKPIKPGEQLEIRVGLWGFGEEDATLPVKRLFVVKVAPDKDGDHLEVALPEGVAE